jgi:hypothetical protein
MTPSDRKVDLAWQLLRIGFVVGPFAAGLDKFFELLADWDMYLAPFFAGLLPFAPETFMKVVGGVEMAVGLLVATRYVRWAAYAASAWLALIAVNLVSSGLFYDLAVRDLELALAALVLALLTEARAARTARAGA